ncbi:MAG TPA: Hsp20/alpha crystallin family protein [Phycisphaerae bacterium]|nr:Hsp20/alpha crystallin family protein [Phycisphaerae bacterium]
MPNIPFPSDLPFSLHNVRKEFDQLLDRVWHVGLTTAPLDGQDWAPSMDVIDEPDRYRVRVEVAGMGAEDIDVTILSNALTIKGCKATNIPPGEEPRMLRSECRYGGFKRKYEFPTDVQEDGVSATCKNGVLELLIPKKPEARGRSVKVSAGGA